MKKIDENINKRIGSFEISKSILLNDYELVNEILSNVVVIECTHRFDNNEYVAISPFFDVVEEGCRWNEYRVIIDTDNIKFEKK